MLRYGIGILEFDERGTLIFWCSNVILDRADFICAGQMTMMIRLSMTTANIKMA